MEIQKIFSEVNTDEKLYSVLMNEDELAFFSEIQKEFARRDYEGLDQQAINDLKTERSEIAKTLLKKREKINKISNQLQSDYNQALDHIKKNGYEVPHTDPKINKMVGKILTNETTAKNDIKSARESGYKKALASAADEAQFEREDALKDTQRRIRREQEAKLAEEDAARKLEREKRIQESTQKYNKKASLGKGITDWAGRNKKAIGLTVAGTAIAGGGAYLYHRSKKNKQNNNTIGPTRINASGGETSTLG